MLPLSISLPACAWGGRGTETPWFVVSHKCRIPKLFIQMTRNGIKQKGLVHLS